MLFYSILRCDVDSLFDITGYVAVIWIQVASRSGLRRHDEMPITDLSMQRHFRTRKRKAPSQLDDLQPVRQRTAPRAKHSHRLGRMLVAVSPDTTRESAAAPAVPPRRLLACVMRLGAGSGSRPLLLLLFGWRCGTGADPRPS